MDIKLMRNLDYCCGIPLCFLLSAINYVLSLFTVKKKENSLYRKILFIKLSEMGSIILAYPLINKIRKENPEIELFFLTFEKNKPLFGILDIVSHNNVLTIREDSIRLFILDTLRTIKIIRGKKIDMAFDLEFFSRFTAMLTYLSGASKRVGFYRYTIEGLYRGDLLTHKVQYNHLLHISKSYLSLWQAVNAEEKSTPELGEKIEDKDIFLPIVISPEEVKRQMRIKLKGFGINEETRLILINSGEGTIPLREWPLENFIGLVKMLLEGSNNFILIIGTKDASLKAKLICKSLNHKRCIDLTQKTVLSEVLDLFNISEALISNDCGLAHIATLTPIKKFILFGPESPQIYSPLGDNTRIIYSDLPCSPCLSAFNHRNSACKDNRCLKRISPEEVYKLISRNL